MMVGRGAKKKGTRYFGPYCHAWAIRETVDLLLRVFPMRSCSNGVFKRSAQIGRPCLLGYIDKCAAPVRRPGQRRGAPRDRRRLLRLHGRPDGGVRAAHREGDVRRLRGARTSSGPPGSATTSGRCSKALEKQAVVLGDGTDADVIALAEDPLEVAVQIFYVRGGRIRGQRGWVADRVDEGGTAELVEDFLLQLYAGEPATPSRARSWCRRCRPTPRRFEQLLGDLRGSKVAIRVPQRGDKRALQETVARNAGRRSRCTRPSAPAT